MHELGIERADHTGVHHRAVEPVEQALPVLGAHQHEGHALDLVRLHQREHLEHLVERAKAAGEHDGARAVKEGGAKAVMSSFNYIGTQWAGGTSALCNTVLRDEWGFRGFVLTDYFGVYGYMDSDMGIRGGTDLLC